MTYIFVGSSKPEAINRYLLKIGSLVNYAGNTHQNALLEGLSVLCEDFKVVSSWSISTYPKVKKIFFKKRILSYGKNKDNYIFIGAINLPIINMIYRFLKMRYEIKKMLNSRDDNAIIIYEVHTPFLLAVTSLRSKIRHINVIVPDLPEHMIAHGNPLRTIAKKFDHQIINYCLKKCDSYTLLSEQMVERLPMNNKKTVLVEGLFKEHICVDNIKKDKHKVIMYTGVLHKDKGIENLINAFENIHSDDYRLWIRGYGDYADEIIEKSKKDKRIVFFEPMSHEELFEMEKKATVMVNPTQPHLEFTKYFFPSKTMEYLASGTPSVMYHLACMPREYENYIFYVDGNTTEALTNKLMEVCEMPREKLVEFGRRASNFILQEKNPFVQCKKIIDIINNDIC